MAIGQSKQRLDAEAKVTGRARYTDDMGLPGMRHAAYVHSTIAHGMVLSIDASEALALPGVEAVFTADDVPGFLFPTAGHPYSMDPSHGDVADRLLLTKHVRYYGDEVAMQGYRDPFNRAFFCWDSHEERLRPVLAQLAQLRHSCEAFRTGELRVLRAEDGILHYQRIGKTETAEIIVNRSEHIIVEPLASGKHTEVNPMGFTIVVEENGHNPNHSYYDIQ